MVKDKVDLPVKSICQSIFMTGTLTWKYMFQFPKFQQEISLWWRQVVVSMNEKTEQILSGEISFSNYEFSLHNHKTTTIQLENFECFSIVARNELTTAQLFSHTFGTT